jgi:tetratricopeptide (TPR) repeat protein
LGGHLEERAAASESLGNACYKSGIDAQRAAGYFRQSLGFYQELGNQRKTATIHSQLGREHMHSGNLGVQDLSTALEHFQQAEEILEQEPEGVPHGMVHCGMAMAHLDRLDLKAALASANRALEIGERLGAGAVIANAAAPLGAALALSDVPDADEILEQGWANSIESKLGFQADLNRAQAAHIFGVIMKDPITGFDWTGRGSDYDTTYSLFDIPAHQVAFHALKGEFDDANRALRELQSRLVALGQPSFGLWPDEMGLLWLRTGEWDRARRELAEALEWAVQSGNRTVEASTAQKLGEVSMAQQDYDNAEHYLLRSRELLERAESRIGELAVLPKLGELYRRMGRLKDAAEHLANARSIENEATSSGALKGDLLLSEGMVAADTGHVEDANAAFQGAVDIYRQFSLPWDEARTYYEWGIALNADDPNSQRARDLLEKSLALWEPMGAIPWAEQCRSQLG